MKEIINRMQVIILSVGVLISLFVAPAAYGAAVSLKSDDAANTSSFTGSTNWTSGLSPTNGNSYFNATHTLRTPVVANGVYTFGGDSLTITGAGNQSGATGEALIFKGSGASGLITVTNLTIDGGELRNGSGDGDYFNLAGNNLTVGSLGMVVHAQGPIILNTPVAGSGTIKIIVNGSTSAARTLHFASGLNAFNGNLVLVDSAQSRFALDAGANLNFIIGASNVNNSVSGSGIASFNGTFVFNLSGAGTNSGDSWTLASAGSQTFGSTFSVDGFARLGGGVGGGTWQATNNGAFYSFDTASGILQVVAQPGTNSAGLMFTNSHVAFLRDSVVATNACLMPAGSYGHAINGISFQDQILLTFGGYQYTAWYDTVGAVQTVWLARRPATNTSVGAWEKVNTGSTFVNGKSGWDAHCVIAIGICPRDGTLHVAWDHHDNTLRYRRSVAGLCTTNQAAWGPGMLNAEQNWLVASGQTELDVTYPQFIATPDGGLVLDRRMGVSGNGDQYFQSYNPATGAWSAKVQFINRSGTYVGPDPFGTTRTCTERCAYLNGFDFGPDGTIHVTWTWRESASQYGNRDICYAYSPDLGTNWYNNAGTKIADTSLGQTITQASSGITVVPLDMRQLLINQQAQCVDNDGRVHVLMLHRRQDSGYEPSVFSKQFSTKFTAYYHYFRDPATGVWTQRRLPVDAYSVGSRPKIGYDAQGNVYAAFLSYPTNTDVVPGYINGKLVIASATKASQYTDWQVVQAFTNDFNGEPLLDQSRLLADNILSVYIQENSTASASDGIPTPLHVFDFAVGVQQADPLALDFSGPDALVTVNAVLGHNYQLQSATTLSSFNWTNAGPVVAGVGGLLALPDPNGRGAVQKFYRVMTDP